MKNVATIVGLLAAFSLTACGPGICERVDAAQTKVFAGKTECKYTEMTGGATSTITITRASASVSACNMNVSKCTSADQMVLEKYAKCVEAAPACSAGNEKASATAMTSCALELVTISGAMATPKVSADCYTAFK